MEVDALPHLRLGRVVENPSRAPNFFSRLRPATRETFLDPPGRPLTEPPRPTQHSRGTDAEHLFPKNMGNLHLLSQKDECYERQEVR